MEQTLSRQTTTTYYSSAIAMESKAQRGCPGERGEGAGGDNVQKNTNGTHPWTNPWDPTLDEPLDESLHPPTKLNTGFVGMSRTRPGPGPGREPGPGSARAKLGPGPDIIN